MEGALECQRATQSRVLTSIDREFIHATDKRTHTHTYRSPLSHRIQFVYIEISIILTCGFEHMSPTNQPYWVVYVSWTRGFVPRLAMFTSHITCREDHSVCVCVCAAEILLYLLLFKVLFDTAQSYIKTLIIEYFI